MNKRARLPFLPRLLLRWFLPLRDREFILGDLDEEFAQRIPVDGRLRTVLWYWRQAAASLLSEARHETNDDAGGAAAVPSGGSWFDAGRQDVRHAWRALGRRPVFTTVALLTLALGIGANTGIFSIVNWLLLRPVPGVTRPQELAMVEISNEPGQTRGISWPNFADILQSQSSFSALAGFGSTRLQLRAENAQPEWVSAHAVGGDYFGTLGLRLQLGRPIRADETASGKSTRVVVISDALWARLFQRDRAVIGKTLIINKLPITIIGVAPAGFEGVERNSGIEAWVAQSTMTDLRHADAAFAERLNGRRGGTMREMVGRLRPGITPDAARADLQRITQALRAQYPVENAIFERYSVFVHPGVGVPVIMRPITARTVRLMLILVGMLLVISSANVGNMLLARGLQARPGAALRRALGASSWRLAGQQIAECLLLATGGGLLGLLVTRAFLQFTEGGQLLGLPALQNIPVDRRVLAFTALVSLGSGLLFTVAPLLVLRRADPVKELQSAGPRHTRPRHGLRHVIAVVQIALSLALLVGAVLLTRTLVNLQRVDLGFDPERTAGMYVSVEEQGYQSDAMPAFRRALLDALRAQPEVESAGLSYTVPFAGRGFIDSMRDPQRRTEDAIEVNVQFASDGYLETLNIPIVRGRSIEPRDWNGTADAPSVVLSETAAGRLFGERDPLGQILEQASSGRKKFLVVGVARDSRLHQLHEGPPALIYLPIHIYPTTQLSAVLRSRTSAAALEPVTRRALATVDPGLPLKFDLISDNVRNSLAEQRLLVRMLSLFSALAVVLAAIGLYGILSFMVGERIREFGIRSALGARPLRIAAHVLQQAALLVILGLALGVLGGRWLGTIMVSTVTGVAPLQTTVYAAALLLFLVVAALATVIPTLVAVRVQPSIALRQD